MIEMLGDVCYERGNEPQKAFLINSFGMGKE